MRYGLIALLALALAGCTERRQTPAPAGATTVAAPEESSTSRRANVGLPMPPYSAPLLDGTTFDLANERGNVVFLNLWATWCGPCRYEIPELELLHKAHAAERFKVVGVSVDEGGEQGVRDFVAEQKMTYPVALDPEGRLAVIFDSYVLPTSVIVDRRGTVVWKKLGLVTMDDEEMIRALEQALQSSSQS